MYIPKKRIPKIRSSMFASTVNSHKYFISCTLLIKFQNISHIAWLCIKNSLNYRSFQNNIQKFKR